MYKINAMVIENYNEIIGTIMAGNDGRRGHIYHLMIKLEHRKNGLGGKLLEKTEKALKKEGIRKIFLVALWKILEKNGFLLLEEGIYNNYFDGKYLTRIYVK